MSNCPRLLSLAISTLSLSGCGDDSSPMANSSPDGGRPREEAGTGGMRGDGAGAGAKSGAEAGPDAAADGAAGSGLEVTLDDGVLEGDPVGGAIRFLSIPYAKPPVGDLRYRAPVKNEAWEGVRHEMEFASPCPQGQSNQSPRSDVEDCLYLNVWKPADAVKDAPVMVWIHGGGFRTGSGGDHVPTSMDGTLWYNGRVFAERHGVVVVTFNYRLSSLGFFAHPALAEEGSPVGNQGMLDQQMVLEWVRDNIEAFGGDPGNVTIFGQSAGSGSVCMHLVSPGSRGLFHRAISQSGGCTTRQNTDRDTLNAQLDAYVEDVGCGDADDVIACLRSKPVEDVVNLETTDRTMGLEGIANIFGVVIDGEGGFLPEPPLDYFERGDIAKVPYILGSNTEESQLYFLFADVPETEEEYLAELAERYGDFADRVAEMYPSSRFDGDYRAAMARIVGDAGLVCGTHDTARRAVSAGLEAYMYNFNITWSIANGILGPTHAAEISHVFGTPYMETPENEEVGVQMNAYWARFARTGDPNGDGAPVVWPVFEPDDNDDDLRIQFDPDYDILESFRKEECAMWREYYALE